MTAPLLEPANVERELAELLEQRAKELIAARDRKTVADALGMGVSGVDTLLWQTDWSLQHALRVLEALGAVRDQAADRMLEDVLVEAA